MKTKIQTQKTFKIDLNLKEYILIREALKDYYISINPDIYPKLRCDIYEIRKRLKTEKFKNPGTWGY